MIIQKWHIYKVILRGPFPKELELRNVGFEEMARTVYPEKKHLGARAKTNNKLV